MPQVEHCFFRVPATWRRRTGIIHLLKANELDNKFDRGRDITKCLDVFRARRPGQEKKRVNVDFPIWMIRLLDKEARRLGVPRQAIIKVWIGERLEKAG